MAGTKGRASEWDGRDEAICGDVRLRGYSEMKRRYFYARTSNGDMIYAKGKQTSGGEVMTGNGPACEPSGDSGFKRINYFTGKLLSEKDFADEQEYYMEKRKLHNRLLHGWGVVCGLRVMPTSPPSRKVSVEPGLAIDCAGNEIIIPKPYVLDVAGTLGCRAVKCGGSNPRGGRVEGPQRLYVVVEYCETPTDPVPSLSTNGHEGDLMEYSRMSEGYSFDLMRGGELPAKCAQVPRSRGARSKVHEGAKGCPIHEPRCCECPFVILAVITWEVTDGATITGHMIRRPIPRKVAHVWRM